MGNGLNTRKKHQRRKQTLHKYFAFFSINLSPHHICEEILICSKIIAKLYAELSIIRRTPLMLS